MKQKKEKELYKALHKAATILYVEERQKEKGGMSVHKVAENI